MAEDVFGLVGTTLDNRYRIDGVVGEGGFGVVYRGLHLAFGQPIAVKCLKVDGRFDSSARALFLKKFREEGAFLSRLSQHPAIVRVFDLNVAASPRVAEVPYLVLEWLDGAELERTLVDRAARRLPSPGEREVIALLRPVIDAIGLAHSLRIAHRDLKPANLFHARVAGGHILKVLDFGIAKSMGDGEAEAALATHTTSGFSAFSPQYGAPEQFRSKRFGATGPWTDVHALGLILSELLSGRAPYPAAELADYYDLACAPQRPTPRRLGAQVSDAVEAICAHAIALEPRDRFPDARALLAALDAAMGVPTPASLSLSGAAPSFDPALAAGVPTGDYLAQVERARSAGFSMPQATPAPLLPSAAMPSTPPGQTELGGSRAQAVAVSIPALPLQTGGPVARPVAASAPRSRGLLYGGLGAAALLALAGGGLLVASGWSQPKHAKTPASPKAAAPASAAPSAPPPSEDTSAEGLRLYRDRTDPSNRAKGIALLKVACDGGYGLGCTGVAWATLYGQGVPKDEKAGREVLETQCSKGTQLACAILADALIDGVAGMTKNEKRAVDLLDTACKSGQMLGCAWLGKAYDDGKAVLKDPKRASELYKQACDAGELRGCWQLALDYTMGTGVDKDEKRAAELAQQACNGGDMTGCFLLAMAYLRGGGVPRDPKRAADLFTEGCNGYHALSCSKLAILYGTGTGVAKDQKHAAEILEKSCGDGDGLGCHSLGILYQKGEGVPQDFKRAAELFDTACKDGRYESCTELGTQYALGQSVSQDMKRAAELFDTGCTGGDAGGCAMLGLLYVKGEGVAADRQKGIDLLRRACKDGEKAGCENLRAQGESP